MESLTGKVVVITGASSGFGKGAALKFAQLGATVVLAARRGDLLEDVAQQCESAGGRALVVPTDVSKEEEVANLAHTAVSKFGRVDVWVNNAGAGAIGRFEEVPLHEHIQVIQTDLMGTLVGSYYAMRQFRSQGAGTLVNISSVIGKVPSPYFASYAAAKHGIVGLDASLRQELTENKIENIHVCTVMPTSFDTPFFEHAAGHTGHRVEPIPPVYDPQEVVDVIVRMATDPEDEVSVGTAAKVATFMHQLFPGLTEKMMGHQTHKAEIEKAPPAAETPGSLEQPIPEGTSVAGGWKK